MACMCGAEEEVDTGPIPGVAGEYTLTAPAGRLGLIFQEVSDPSGEYRHVVARLGDNSQMAGQIEAGDVIMYINAGAASHLNHTMITKQLQVADTGVSGARTLVIKRGAIKGSDGNGWAPAA